MSIRTLSNKTVKIQRPKTAAGTLGNQGDLTWPNIATIRCRIEPVSGNETDRSGKTTAEVTHMMYCGKRVDIEPSDRVIAGSATYRVDYVNKSPGGLQRHKEVMLVEYVA